LQHGLWQYCAVYEDELQRLWPLAAPHREARIADFAVRYGFRLRFYQKGLCAIFDEHPRYASTGNLEDTIAFSEADRKL
jgi:hypothetical protein